MRPAYTRKRLADALRAVKLEPSLRARDAWSRERLEGHQRERLQGIVRHAAARSPFYAERFAHLDLGRPVELADLPPVTKQELMARFDDWPCDRRLTAAVVDDHLATLERDDYLLDEYRAMATGGSTGRRGVFVFDRREWSVLLALLLRLTREMGNRPQLPRPRIANIGAPSALHMTRRIGDTLNVGLYRRLGLSATQPVGELVDELNRFRPDMISAYPSVAALLADEQVEGRLRIAPRALTTTSELCTDEMRDRIRAAWAIEPFDMYGATDGLWGASCDRHRGIHFAEDLTIVEAEEDRILITNLFMRTQPVIRYEITDLVRFSPEPCPCGRPSRVVERIEGRSDDVLRLPGPGGGAVAVHPIHLRSPLARVGALRQYQVVHRADGLHVRAVPRNGAGHTALRDEVRAALAGALRDAGVAGTAVHVDVVDALERAGGAGKLKLVRSEVPAGT